MLREADVDGMGGVDIRFAVLSGMGNVTSVEDEDYSGER